MVQPPYDAIASGTPAWHVLADTKQRQIAEAAIEEFAEHGYSGASMNSLVKAAGISKGSLFNYFHTKGDLFGSIVDVAFGRVKAQVKAVRDDTRDQPLDARLERLLEAGFQFVTDHPRLARIYFRVLRSGDAPFGRRRVEELGHHSRRFLADLVADAQQRGEVDPALDPTRTAWLLDAMMERLLAAWHEGQLAGDLTDRRRENERRAWVTSFRALVARGLAPTTEETNRG